MSAREVWITGPGQVDACPVKSRMPGAGQVRIRTSVCGISSGTELLAYRGQLPASSTDDSAVDPHASSSGYPMRTGYCLVGVIEAIGIDVDQHWMGRRVFSFQPHGSEAVVSIAEVIPVPDEVSDELATFIPNLETAIGLVMDARPMLGERVVVLGQGVVGLLVTRLLAGFPLDLLAVVDPLPERRECGRSLGAHWAIDPGNPDELSKLENRLRDADRPGADIVLELSGNPAGLNHAVTLAGFGARILAGSWYGNKLADVDLGGRFHRNRISLISSQVSTIAPDLTGRWTKQRRMDQVLRLLPDLHLERLITHRIPLDQAASAFELIDRHPGEAIQVVLTRDDDYQDGST